jgi:6-phosphogluconolactonase (cycloisomerase 2 family)
VKRTSLYSILTLIILFTIFAVGAMAQGKFIYTNNNRKNHNSVSGFKVNPDGSINLLPGMPVPTGDGGGVPNDSGFSWNKIVTTTKGPYLFASNAEEQTIASYRINPMTGELTFIERADIGGGNLKDEIPLATTPNEKYLYAGNQAHNRLHALRINDDGTLTEIETEQIEGFNPRGLRVSPDGRFLAVQLAVGEFADLQGRIAMFSIAANGEIIPVPGSPFKGSSDGRVEQGVFNCEGNRFFVTKIFVNSLTIDVFSVSQNGSLTLIDGAPFNFPNFEPGIVLAITPNGKYLYISAGFPPAVHALKIKPNGQLEMVVFSPFPASSNEESISSLAVDAMSKHLFVTYSNQRVESLLIDSDGSLSTVEGGFGGTNEDNGLNQSFLNSLAVFPLPKQCQIQVPDDITAFSGQFDCGGKYDYPTPTICGTDCGTVTCNPPSGSFFPVGTTKITCSAEGADEASFKIIVEDHTAPLIIIPSDIVVSTDANKCSAKVNFQISATDACDGVVPIEIDFPSGSEFPKGETIVHIKATDKSDNTGNSFFKITVMDAQTPTINCVTDVSVNNAPNQCGALVNYQLPTVSDNCSGVGVVNCNPPAGSFFPIGQTMVTCTVKDAANNQAQCSFKVTVKDTQAPTIQCPADKIAATATPCSTSVVVNYPAPTVGDNCPNNLNVICSPASGSVFPVGTTNVTCTVTDGGSNQTQCSFKVTIFNVWLQDESNTANVLLFNSITGEYRLCVAGMNQPITGVGTVMKQGCSASLLHNTAERRVMASVDGGGNKGNATYQSPPGTLKATIIDKNIINNTSLCQ